MQKYRISSLYACVYMYIHSTPTHPRTRTHTHTHTLHCSVSNSLRVLRMNEGMNKWTNERANEWTLITPYITDSKSQSYEAKLMCKTEINTLSCYTNQDITYPSYDSVDGKISIYWSLKNDTNGSIMEHWSSAFLVCSTARNQLRHEQIFLSPPSPYPTIFPTSRTCPTI